MSNKTATDFSIRRIPANLSIRRVRRSWGVFDCKIRICVCSSFADAAYLTYVLNHTTSKQLLNALNYAVSEYEKIA